MVSNHEFGALLIIIGLVVLGGWITGLISIAVGAYLIYTSD